MLSVCSTAPMHGTAKYASRCSWLFHMNVPTASPGATPSRASAFARRSAFSATWAKVARRTLSPVNVTHSDVADAGRGGGWR